MEVAPDKALANAAKMEEIFFDAGSMLKQVHHGYDFFAGRSIDERLKEDMNNVQLVQDAVSMIGRKWLPKKTLRRMISFCHASFRESFYISGLEDPIIPAIGTADETVEQHRRLHDHLTHNTRFFLNSWQPDF